MKVKSYEDFVNEEISRKSMLGAMGGVMLGKNLICSNVSSKDFKTF
jgi:hypothetical protein